MSASYANGAGPEVIQLSPADAGRYLGVRRRMLVEAPWAFTATSEDDVALDEGHLRELLRQNQNAILAIEAGEVRAEGKAEELEEWVLVAVAGILRIRNPKFAHRARLWGVFVVPELRGQGLGRRVAP